MSHSPVETHASVQSQTQVQKQQTLTGPPFVIDSTATYQDQNAQAWTQYYAQGGTDPAGTEHFISVPGINGRTLSAHCGGTIGGRRTTSTTTASHIGRVFLVRLRERFTWTYRYTGPRAPELVANSYGQSSSSTNGEAVSAETGGPDMEARAPWETTAATMTLPGQFEQTRVAWASPCRRLIMGVRRSR